MVIFGRRASATAVGAVMTGREPALAPDLGGARWPAKASVRRRAEILAVLGLAVLTLGGAWLALGAAADPELIDTAGAPTPDWAFGPLAGLSPGGLNDTTFGVALLAMFAAYAVVVVFAEAMPVRLGLGVLGLLVSLFALAPPLLSSDVFGYIGYARLGVVHGLDPYLHGPAAAPHDPVLPLLYWKEPSSPYGPLFTLISFGVGWTSVAVALWTMKALAAIGCLATLAFAWRAAERLGRGRKRAVLLIGANPILLVFALGGAHNDVLAMSLATAGIWLLATRRTAAAGTALVAAAAVKLTGGLLLPFALLAARPRRRLLIAASSAGAVIAVVTLAVFGRHVLDTVYALATDPQFNADYSGPDLLGRLLGTGIGPTVHLVCAVAAAAVLIAVARGLKRGMDWLTAAGWTAVMAACVAPSFVPWYVAWALPMAALARSRYLQVAMIVLTGAVVVTHLPILGFPSYE